MHFRALCTCPRHPRERTTKTLRVMKLTAIFLLAVTLQVSAAGYSQKVTLSFREAPLEKVFREFKKQTGYLFFYNLDWLQKARKVTIQVHESSPEQALQEIFKDQSLTYTIINRTVVIKLRDTSTAAGQFLPPQQQVKGVVRDENGAPLAGASILVKGTKNGTVTAGDGSFSLETTEGAILEISMVGYRGVTVRLSKNDGVLSITLEQVAAANKEIVVVGYGTQKKVNLTGSVASIGSRDLSGRPITGTSAALQGLLPGVTVVNGSGKPGGGSTSIRIRGVGTTNNPDPLILIDGLEGNIDLLNPEDIESVSVLKDAASAAIYGSRGANGVILVTTKKGTTGLQQPVVSYSGYAGWQQPTRLPKYVGSAEFMEMQNEALTNVGKAPSFTDDQILQAKEGSNPDFYSNTNWVNEIFRSEAFQQNHNLSVRGGSGKTSYYMSYGYLDQEGIVIANATGATRNNLRLHLNTSLLGLADLDANVGYVDRSQTDPAIGLTGNTGLIYTAHEMTPLVPVKFSTGTWGYGGVVYNPVSLAYDGGRNKLAAQDITGQLGLTLHLLKDLSLRGQYGQVFSNASNNIETRKISYYSPLTGALFTSNVAHNKIEQQNYWNRYQNLSAQLDYSHSWGHHSFQGLAGASQEWNVYKEFSAAREDLLNENLPIINLASGTQTTSGFAGQWAIRSLFGRFNYNYDGKYLLEANLRYDGSSRFAPDHRWGAFPSVSAGWHVSKEAFMQATAGWLNDLKLRASWGKLGNDKLLAPNQLASNAALYPYLGTFNSARSMPLNLGGVQTDGYQQNVLGNAIVTWEKVTMQDVGIDMEFFGHRLAVTADYYKKVTNGILLKVPLPDVLGMNEPNQNAGSVENKGWELAIGWNDQAGSLRYSLQASLADVKNKVTSLGGTPPTIADQVRLLGYPIDAFYGLVAERIAQESDFTKDANGNYVPLFPVIAGDKANIRPGDLIYRDLNGDTAISLDKDRTVIGSPVPRYTYSFRGELNWHNFDLAFFLQGVGKADGYISGNGRHAFYNEASFPQEFHRDRWTPTNTDATYPRFTYLQNHNRYLSTFWLENAAYLRLKNIQLGYSFRLGSVWKNHLQKLRVYASADNLFTRTKFLSSFDPETPVSDGGYYPQVKVYVVGVNLTIK